MVIRSRYVCVLIVDRSLDSRARRGMREAISESFVWESSSEVTLEQLSR